MKLTKYAFIRRHASTGMESNHLSFYHKEARVKLGHGKQRDRMNYLKNTSTCIISTVLSTHVQNPISIPADGTSIRQ